LKKLRQWVLARFGQKLGRDAIRRILQAARLSYKKFKKLLGKAEPQKRVEHMTELEGLFAQVCRGEVTPAYIDESHFHRDMDQGYTWSKRGGRAGRVSACPGLSERLNWYGAYDFTHGQCLIWEDGMCNGVQTCHFLDQVARWRADLPGQLVVIWDKAPSHVAKVVQAHAEGRGIKLVALPGYSPDLNPIERLWDGMREEVTRGHCHSSLAGLRVSCQQFIAEINGDPEAVIDRLWPKFDLDPEYEAKLLVST
jgi:DDE superfamily endonuclease